MSAGRCVVEAPASFGFDAQELAVTLPGVAELDDAEILRIARRCPSQAVVVINPAGGRVEI